MALAKNTTIQQIAAKAGVSTATASRVINRPDTVKSDTRERVLQAMKELNYQAKQDNGRLLLAAFPNFTNPFYGLCIQGMQEAAWKRGYQILLQQIDNPKNPDSYRFLMDHSFFHGVIFTHPLPEISLLDSILARHPIVMCSQYHESDDLPCVIIEDYAAAKSAVSYLLSIGKKRIAMLNTQLDYSFSQYREQGYLDALQEAGLPILPHLIVHASEVDYNLAFSMALTLLDGEERPDSVFCSSDVLASAVIKAAGQLNLSVPGDVAVMGFDNVDLCNMTVPTISTVSQPMYQLGWQSCNLLIDQLEDIPLVSKRIVLPTDIVVRKST